MPSLAESTAPDTEELAHFRNRWKEEIRDRGQLVPPTPSGSSQRQAAQPSVTFNSRLKSALETYTHGVAEEQRGNHPEATRLYRNAFRLDPNVDKAYHRDELTHQLQSHLSSTTLPISVASLSLGDTKTLSLSQDVTTTTTLAFLLQSWPHPLLFAPEDQTIGVPINRLPDELIISILSNFAVGMDANSIERFASVSRRARMLSLDMSVWRWVGQANLRDTS
jgi:F-box protein 9